METELLPEQSRAEEEEKEIAREMSETHFMILTRHTKKLLINELSFVILLLQTTSTNKYENVLIYTSSE